jgi:tetratricopeptide (TPR) repeat protein
VNSLTIGLLGALLATNQPQAASNLLQQTTGVAVAVTSNNGPAEPELQKLMDDDDTAQAEVDKWIRDNNAFAVQGAGESRADLNKRILARFNSVRKGYEDFLRRHPDSAPGHLAYGSFLNEIGDEDAAELQNQTAAQLDPKNPAAWNNLANYFGENGPVTNAFVDYAKAIALNPQEPVYYQNFATTVYLFRKDAREFYGITEQQVFDKALDLYRQAVRLDPDNFPLMTDYAQSYYGIRPLRTNDALVAWTNALKIARDDVDREGVFIHLARIKIAAGIFSEAQAQLDAVTNAAYADLKKRLLRNLAERQNAATNLAAADISTDSIHPPPAMETVPNISTNVSASTASTPPVATAATNIVSSLPASDEATPANISAAATNVIVVLTNVAAAPANVAPALAPGIADVVSNAPAPAINPTNLSPRLFALPPPTLRPIPPAPSE